ncbi:transcriptional regulator [Ralstonia syzygii subsp. celebesensis]|nr:helix-turn-helix domain-containing protein [Ralstonia syzygii]QQV54347.1 transcriptional regulator [Ralstonia syzygii subsp. celebesensis]CCA79400.1 putative phage protein p31 [blood disease bacterium R229]
MPTATVPTPYCQKPDELVRTLIRAGWSQSNIAATIDVSQPTISRILSTQHKDPRASVVEKLRQLVLNLDEFKAA